MRFLEEAANLVQECDLIERTAVRIELRAARLLAALLWAEMPQARYLELHLVDGGYTPGPVLDGDNQVLAGDAGNYLSFAEDIDWLAGLLRPDGDWEEVCGYALPAEESRIGVIALDIDKASAIEIEE